MRIYIFIYFFAPGSSNESAEWVFQIDSLSETHTAVRSYVPNGFWVITFQFVCLLQVGSESLLLRHHKAAVSVQLWQQAPQHHRHVHL